MIQRIEWRVETARKPTTGLKQSAPRETTTGHQVETARKPTTGLKLHSGTLTERQNAGRDSQKTHDGIETLYSRRAFSISVAVETARKPTTGLKHQ